MKEIPLTRGKVTLVDDEDFEWLNQWKWQCSASGYAIRRLPRPIRETIWMHREIMHTPKGMDTDHINCNRSDNRRCNLRICTRSQNKANAFIQANNTSGYKGIKWHGREKLWLAYIQVNGKECYLGSYKTKEDAALAYNNGAIKYFGEFAKINVIA